MNTETRQEIIGIVMCHGKNDYGYGSAIAVLIVMVCVGMMYFVNQATRRYDRIYE